MKKALFMVMFLPSLALAAGPKYTYPSMRGLDDEMNNIYHDIKNPVINQETVSSATITNLSIGTTSFIYTPWVSYTPSFGAGYGTVTHINFFWRQVGDTVFVKGAAEAGTVGAGSLTISLPSGKPINYIKMVTVTNSDPLGTYGIARATPFVGLVIGDGSTTTTVNWTSGSSSGSVGSVYATATGNSVFDSTDYFVVDFSYATN